MIPACQGVARFDDLAQAEYLAEGLSEEGDGAWEAVSCGDHWHVEEVLDVSEDGGDVRLPPWPERYAEGRGNHDHATGAAQGAQAQEAQEGFDQARPRR